MMRQVQLEAEQSAQRRRRPRARERRKVGRRREEAELCGGEGRCLHWHRGRPDLLSSRPSWVGGGAGSLRERLGQTRQRWEVVVEEEEGVVRGRQRRRYWEGRPVGKRRGGAAASVRARALDFVLLLVFHEVWMAR